MKKQLQDGVREAQIARIVPLAEKWQKLMGLDWIDITHKFNDINTGDDIAKAHARWEYLEATIQWNIEGVAGLDDVELEKTVVHELCHCVLNSVEDCTTKGSEKEIEFACSGMARSILSVWQADKI